MSSRNLLYQKCVAKLHYDFAVPITTAAWVELDSSLDAPFDAVEILNTSGAVLKLSTGAAAAEDNSELPYYVLPGKSILVPLALGKSKRLSAKAVGSVDAADGDLYMNFLG